MKLYLRSAFLIIFLLFVIPFVVTLYEASYVYQHTVSPINNTGDVFQQYADEISSTVPVDETVVIIVPLNGTPDSLTHTSVKNAYTSFEVLRRIEGRKKVLVLSEGYQKDSCVSGADITLFYLGLQEGYNSYPDMTILLEREASTTYENILFSENIVKEALPQEKINVIVAGISDIVYSFKKMKIGADIGHGARAYVLAKQQFTGNSNIVLNGFIPTNQIDKTVQNYSRIYNILTMLAGSVGILGTSFFDKEAGAKPIASC